MHDRLDLSDSQGQPLLLPWWTKARASNDGNVARCGAVRGSKYQFVVPDFSTSNVPQRVTYGSYGTGDLLLEQKSLLVTRNQSMHPLQNIPTFY